MTTLIRLLEERIGQHATNAVLAILPFTFILTQIAISDLVDRASVHFLLLVGFALTGALAIGRIIALLTPKRRAGAEPDENGYGQAEKERIRNVWKTFIKDELAKSDALEDLYAPIRTSKKYDAEGKFDDNATDTYRYDETVAVIWDIKDLDKPSIKESYEYDWSLPKEELEAAASALPLKFSVKLLTKGNPEKKVEALADTIKALLDLYKVEIDSTNETGSSVTFICYTTKPEDKLLKSVIGQEFFDEYNPIEQMAINPRVKPNLIPIALTEEGEPFIWERKHTLVIGTSGSGKNSPLVTMIRQDEDLILQGSVAPYALISPKDLDLMKLQQSSLVDPFAGLDQLKQLKVIGSFYKTMMKRTQRNEWQASLNAEQRAEAKAQGKLEPFKHKTLMIDEYSEFYTAVEKLFIPGLSITTVNKFGEEEEVGLTAGKALSEILAKGRAMNCYLVAAAQDFNQDAIGKKNNWQYVIMLRIPSAKSQWIDAAFGEGQKAQGVRPDLIPKLPNSGSAGIAYVEADGLNAVRVRFPYTNNDEFDAIVDRTFEATPYNGPTEFPTDL